MENKGSKFFKKGSAFLIAPALFSSFLPGTGASTVGGTVASKAASEGVISKLGSGVVKLLSNHWGKLLAIVGAGVLFWYLWTSNKSDVFSDLEEQINQHNNNNYENNIKKDINIDQYNINNNKNDINNNKNDINNNKNVEDNIVDIIKINKNKLNELLKKNSTDLAIKLIKFKLIDRGCRYGKNVDDIIKRQIFLYLPNDPKDNNMGNMMNNMNGNNQNLPYNQGMGMNYQQNQGPYRPQPLFNYNNGGNNNFNNNNFNNNNFNNNNFNNNNFNNNNFNNNNFNNNNNY